MRSWTLAISCVAVVAAVAPATAAGTTKAVVVDSGTAPDGSRYEHVVHTRVFRARGLAATPMVCKSLRWPGHARRGGTGAFCEDTSGRSGPMPDPTFAPKGLRFVQPGRSGEGVEQPDVIVTGTTSARVASIAVSYRDPAGTVQHLPVAFRRAAGRRLAGRTRLAAFGVFTSFLPGAVAARDGLAARAAAGDRAPGQPPLGNPLWTGDLGGLTTGGGRCPRNDGWDGPFRIAAYDVSGRRLADPRRDCSSGAARARAAG